MLKEMHYAYEVYKEQSFSKAAKNLYISQPALSAIIRRLEDEIHQPLFDRSTNPIQLTSAGAYYIQNIEQIMTIERNLQTYFDDLSNLRRGSLRIGGATFFCTYIIPPLISRFSEQYPGINIELIEASTNEVLNMLQQGLIDLAFDSTPLDNTLFDVTRIYEEEILLAVPASWPVNEQLTSCRLTFSQAKKKKYRANVSGVPLHLFADLPFLFLHEGNDLYTRSVAMCKAAGFFPQIQMYLDQMMTLYHMSKSQMGATFLRDSILNYEVPTDKLYFYKLDSSLNIRHVSISCKKKRYVSHVMTTFIDFCKSQYKV